MKSHNYTKAESFQAQFDNFSNIFRRRQRRDDKVIFFVTLLTKQKQGAELMQQVKIGKIFIVFS